MKIYLADLVYDTIKTNYVVPLNIAYLAASLAERFESSVTIQLFKYPTDLERAMRQQAPDILGVSNYSWNTRLGNLFLTLGKELNPAMVTVMGGPQIRHDPADILTFLQARPSLDYYILHEGEEPLTHLVHHILQQASPEDLPSGVAGRWKDGLLYRPVEYSSQPREIRGPSPYLTGWLDPFLANGEMIPLLETTRGCPYGCIYCEWGAGNLSKLRQRPLAVVEAELDYVAEHAAVRSNWIFADANFGLLKRDLDIARKIQSLRIKNGSPHYVTVWSAKNTTQRNLEISDTFRGDASQGTFAIQSTIALQSTDPEVLEKTGRGQIKFQRLHEQILAYRERGLELSTDILIGLPGESAASHLKTLQEAFALGFARIDPINIRLLPGTDYESDSFRREYRIETRFRPIFGAYGVYHGQRVFEVEESVRATQDMTETELNSFKVLHWLIYFCWNAGFFRPQLRFGLEHGCNPGSVLQQVAQTDDPVLQPLFAEMRALSQAEWFATEKEMLQHYEQPEHYGKMVDEFLKLNFAFCAQVYQKEATFMALERVINERLRIALSDTAPEVQAHLQGICRLSTLLLCKDPLESPIEWQEKAPADTLRYLYPNLCPEGAGLLDVVIQRNPQAVEFCRHHLLVGGKKDLSVRNFSRFLEMGGMMHLRRELRVVS
ncbi:MAG: B12-binding domain-containing radical SAM protein [Magnetococcales bacterium]|nr:B12-binding domain-containing radical SAM protein [Magnetococcales bacterium]MBF0322567.1 B12-binding domain-containing radical SAM protein [Magnetococcales bacterium]